MKNTKRTNGIERLLYKYETYGAVLLCMCYKSDMNQSNHSKLAYEIAEALHDMKSIDLHISYAKKYSEQHLRQLLSYALTQPGIRNRAAYYNSLVQRHGSRPRN